MDRFDRRVVVVRPGEAHAYDPAEWRDALVVVERGMIELETSSGVCRSFVAGDVLWLVGLPLRLLRNRGPIPAVVASIARR
jgi:hypothetical protein